MFRSFCMTIRPRGGINDQLVLAVTKWLGKQAHAFACLEMENEARHLHGQVWFENPKHKNDITKQLKRFCEAHVEDWDACQSRVLSQGVKIAYSDWYIEYLLDNDNKGPNENILINNPPGYTEQYYPSLEEQDKVKSIANSVDPRFTKLEYEFWEWFKTNISEDVIDICPSHVTQTRVAKFLSWAMFANRSIKVITKHTDRVALSRSLFLYISQSECSDNFLALNNEEKKLSKGLNYVMESLKLENNI